MNDDGFSEFKALVVILFTEMFLLFFADALASIIIGRKLLFSTQQTNVVIAIAILLAMGRSNYWLVEDDKWTRFKEEFDAYPVRTLVLSRIALAVLIIGSFVAALVTGSVVRKLPW